MRRSLTAGLIGLARQSLTAGLIGLARRSLTARLTQKVLKSAERCLSRPLAAKVWPAQASPSQLAKGSQLS